MDEQKVREAIEVLKGIEEVRGNLPEDGNEIEEAFLVAIEALEKQLPKKPKQADEQRIRYCTTYVCPECGKEFTGMVSEYCYHCGQLLDWSEQIT